LILDAPTGQLAALRALGYKEVSVKQNARVDFLAFNHRKPQLVSQPLRRAIAHALDREGLLNRHFRGPKGLEKYHRTLNGITPRGSWATCPAPRVPGELYNAEQARLFAKQAQKNLDKCELTLHYPRGDARLQRACEEIAQTINDVLNSAGIKSKVSPQPVAPQELRRIINDREFDIAYMSEENTDQPYAMAMMFDGHENAKKPGGRNYLGYDGDIKMQELMRSALAHRQFSVVQTNMHALHAHLHETMPLVPLWQLDCHVLAQPSLRMQPVNSASVFANVASWEWR
jgi:ABC-type oligopeptide transport system substrate-binding subunit